jgi:quercetin dioxygenase-like cupin family protein
MLLSALAAGSIQGQNRVLASNTWLYEDLPVRVNGANRSRAVLNGETHTGYPIEVHETELAPGEMPHPPHHHVHEEMLIMREGMLEVTIQGRSARLGPGSVAYVASGEQHGWRNVGTSNARYFVLAFGADR